MNQQGNSVPTTSAVEIEDLTVEASIEQRIKAGTSDRQNTGNTYYVGSANGGVWK
jgi:hypothetical protein